MASSSGKKSWFRTIVGGIVGLCSGAAIMYVTPLVEKVVKPAAPLANFEARADGLTVHFDNLAQDTVGLEGWWDFGDGSPLVALVPEQDVVHTYAKPGGYTARLMVKNFLGDKNERAVTLQLDQPAPESPRILTLDVLPVTPNSLAPATFKVATELKNAQLAVWDLDENRPLEVAAAPSGKIERLVTFEKPGGYVIKLAAFNGQQHEQKTVAVNVRPAPVGALTAVLHVTDQATQVERSDRRFQFSCSFPPDHKGNVYAFKRTANATAGWTITDVAVKTGAGTSLSLQGKPAMELEGVKAGAVRNLRLERDADGKTVRISGEMVRNSASDLATMNVPVVLREERRKPASRQPHPVKASLTAPGVTQLMLPPMPEGWESPQRQVKLELRDGNKVLWQETKLPAAGRLQVRDRRYSLTAQQTGELIQVSMSEVGR